MKQADRKIIIGLFAGMVLILIAYISVSVNSRQVQADSGQRMLMDTFARIIAVAENKRTADNAIEAGFEQIENIESMMNIYKADSEISVVNRNASNEPVKITDTLFEVLQKSIEYSRKTAGAFDITVGPLVKLFKNAKKENAIPTTEQIEQAKSKTGYQKLKLDAQKKTIKFQADGMSLDLGGIAKGFAIDKAIEAMRTCGATGGMVDVGGDIRCFNQPAGGKNRWQIGLQNPQDTQQTTDKDKLLLVLQLNDNAVTTSGDYERFVIIKGKKFSHIINPATGWASKGLSSVTIIAKTATQADALATAVSVMGAEAGLELIEAQAEVEAILISQSPDFKMTKTSGADRFITD